MTLQEKIQKKAEGFGKLAPVFLEGAKFALENQWINVEEDLPCNHPELICESSIYSKITIPIIAEIHNFIIMSKMYKIDDKWYWENNEPTYWMPIPKQPKEQEDKLWKRVNIIFREVKE